MIWTAIGILGSALLVMTMPPGAEHDGAVTIVGMQGMAFNVIAIGYGIRWAWRERHTIKRIFRDLVA